MPGTDRYQLVDRIVDGTGWCRWRGHDVLLRRDVGVLVLAPDHPRQAAVAEAARRASLVTDSRFLHVYDVTSVGAETWVVEEWVPSTDLRERVTDHPLPPADACAVGVQVAHALAAAHAQGVTHGALGPDDVRLTDDGRVKIQGLATSVLLEDPPTGGRPALADRAAADSWAAAAVTFAALTGRWPGGPCGLPGVPSGAAATRPGLVRPGIPKAIDAAVFSALRSPPADPTEVARSLESVLAQVGRRSADRVPDRPPRLAPGTARAIAAGAGAALVAAIGAGALWLGFELTRDPNTFPPTLAASEPSSSAPTDGARPGGTFPARLQVVTAWDFDPEGNGEEQPDLVPFAYDGNPATAWHTMTYRQPDLAPKSGVGVVFDLGRIETVGAVRLNLLGAGTSLEVRVSRAPGTRLADFQKFGAATNLGDLVALRAPEPVQARYVLVWFTRLPADGSGYRGGICEIEVARN